MTSFGSQLIGETEKNLTALLRRLLDGTGLTEPHWVTLRLAAQNDTGRDLAGFVADQAHFADATALVALLADRGLVAGDDLTEAGHAFLDDMRARIASYTAPVWAALPAEDVAAAERVLNAVSDRARALLAA